MCELDHGLGAFRLPEAVILFRIPYPRTKFPDRGMHHSSHEPIIESQTSSINDRQCIDPLNHVLSAEPRSSPSVW